MSHLWYLCHLRLKMSFVITIDCFFYTFKYSRSYILDYRGSTVIVYVNPVMPIGSSSDAEDRGAAASWDVGGEEAAKGSRAATSQGALGLSH